MSNLPNLWLMENMSCYSYTQEALHIDGTDVAFRSDVLEANSAAQRNNLVDLITVDVLDSYEKVLLLLLVTIARVK